MAGVTFNFLQNFSEIFQCTVDHVSAFDKANGRPFVAVSLLHCTSQKGGGAAAAAFSYDAILAILCSSK